jgi:hypothetical protein
MRAGAAAAFSTALLASASPALAAPDAGDASAQASAWHCWKVLDASDGDAGGVSLEVKCHKHVSGFPYIRAKFYANGEHLFINDRYANGRAPVARLSIGGSGTATFWGYSYGDRHFNKSYSEGKSVKLQICTSSSSKAFCSPTYSGGIT